MQCRLPLILEPPCWAGQNVRSMASQSMWGCGAWWFGVVWCEWGKREVLFLLLERAMLGPSSALRAFYVFYIGDSVEKIQKLCWKQGSGPRSGLQCTTEIVKCVVRGPEHMLVPLLTWLLLSLWWWYSSSAACRSRVLNGKRHCPPRGEEDAQLAGPQDLNQESTG